MVRAVKNNYTEAVSQAFAAAFLGGGGQAGAYGEAWKSIVLDRAGDCWAVAPVLTRKCSVSQRMHFHSLFLMPCEV
jgi:hypothetical protein